MPCPPLTFVANFLHEFLEFGESDGAVPPGLALHLVEGLPEEALLAEPVRRAADVLQEVADAFNDSRTTRVSRTDNAEGDSRVAIQ